MKNKRRISVLIVFTFCLAIVLAFGCGGGGNNPVGGSGLSENPSVSGNPFVGDYPDDAENPTLISGSEALSNGDFKKAGAHYCGVLIDDNTSSEAAFGCAMTRFIRMGESEPISAILEGIGERAFDMQADFFDKGKFLETYFEWYYAIQTNWYNTVHATTFPWLPVVGYFSQPNHTWTSFLDHLLEQMLSSGMTIVQVQDRLLSLLGELEEIHLELGVAKADAQFYFTIPKGFFYTQSDVTVKPADLYVFDLIAQNMRFVISLAGKYEPGVDISKISTPEDPFDAKELAKSLNGEYGTIFGTLKDNVSDLNDIKPIFEDMLGNADVVVNELPKAGKTELFKGTALQYKKEFDEAKTLISELRSSLTNGLTTLSISKGKVSVDLKKAFSTPPNAADLAPDTPDPIVYITKQGGQGKLHFVESFFKSLFAGLAEFDL